MHLGRYELIGRLAKGGMGEVFLARRRGPGDIEKRVVIKRIRRELSGDPRFVEMFLSEARVSMTLSHKNIVPVFDFGRAGSELFLAMEYVRGRDLARALRAAGGERPLSPAAVAHIGIEVCRALDYAHHRGDPIIHRDLSPKNLLLSFSGEVVVADFGLAVSVTDELARAGVRGTPAYMSPEQARGEAIDGRSDLFSLALVLRELLTGEPGHGRGEPAEIIERARGAEIEPLGDGVPAALAAAINRALDADPDKRFDGARAMQVALDDYLVAARTAGAALPTHEIADWLSALFPDPDVNSRPITIDGLDAVTYLDDGEDAVDAEVRKLREGSLVETIADSVLAAAEPVAASDPGEASSRDRDGDGDDGGDARPSESRFWLYVAGGGAALAALAWGVSSLGGGAPAAVDGSATRGPAIADAAPAARGVDAGLVAADAAPAIADAAPRAVTDAAAPRPPAEPGTLKVNTTRGWAEVAIPRARKRCPETPCTFTLKPGRYTVEIRNPVDGSKTTRPAVVESGKTATLLVPL